MRKLAPWRSIRGRESILRGFLAYHIASVVIGAAATVVVLTLYPKTENPKLPPLLVSNFLLLLFIIGMSYELCCDVIGLETVVHGVVHEAEQFVCLGLCVAVPRVSRPPIVARFPRRIERGFTVASGLVALAFGAFFLFPFNRAVYNAFYGLIYLDLSLVLLYFGLSFIFFGRRSTASSSMRHYSVALSILRALTIALFPALFVVDFIGWMVPFLTSRIPVDFSLLPAFYILMSLIMLIGSIKEILEPEPLPEPMKPGEDMIRKHDLSRREAEVLPYVLQFLTYKEIGERLFISSGTVRTHLVHIYRKTGARNRLELSRIIQGGRGAVSPTPR